MDYNIYIHSYSQYDSPTTPMQLRANGDSNNIGGEGDNGQGFSGTRRAASFVTNPDSLIGEAMATTTGALANGFSAFSIIFATLTIGKKILDAYVPYVSNQTGDFELQVKYNNFLQNIHNAFRPFGTDMQRSLARMEQIKENRRNEQERLLLGGTIYNSRYGRYLWVRFSN